MLEILTLHDEILRKQSSIVTEFDQDLHILIQNMFDTMYTHDGIGLAAPQVGVMKRFFICHIQTDGPRVFVNPEITGTSFEESVLEEGCLSIPGVYSEIRRPSGIEVQAWNEKGKIFSLKAEGLLARVIQHEMDHLNGVLFIDRVDSKKRERLVKQFSRKLKVS